MNVSIGKVSLKLHQLFEKHFGEAPNHIDPLPASASARRYFRLSSPGYSAIGAYNPDTKENQTFLYLSDAFAKQGVNVPEIFISEEYYYLQEDLGNVTLMDFRKEHKGFPVSVYEQYLAALRQLAKVQTKVSQHIDYDKTIGRVTFDTTAMLRDMHYFKYYFLKRTQVAFEEELLEEDFSALARFLAATPSDYFMLRDFQSRNIMLHQEKVYFIDYQGGKKGALQYDLASLLFQSKAEIPHEERQKLLEDYLDELSKYIKIDRQAFKEAYYGFVLIRILQVLGAYGLRGLIEGKKYFIESIPLAIKNLAWWLEEITLPIDLPHLTQCLQAIVASKQFDIQKVSGADSSLVVHIYSFSYKENIPSDESGNGGGFVFDCRFLHNPGRYEAYKTLTGRDAPVQDFLLTHSQMPLFLKEVFNIVDKAVENYIERKFESLQVSFGCTGGQHRSVFAADSLAKHLQDKYQVNTQVKHIVQERKNWINKSY